MTTADHAMSPTFGSSAGAAAFRAQQQALIQSGRYLDALKMDVNAIRAIHGARYDGAIDQMGQYVWRMGQ
jgi:filamentous hemagglutinin